MAKYTIIKLVNISPLHIGTGKENYDFSASNLHSDTLTSALAAIRAQQKSSDDLEVFLNSFTMSSAFPFSGNRYFLPKPQGKINVVIKGKEEHEYRKKLKKIKYLELSLWKKLIQGDKLEVEEMQLKNEFLLSDSQQFESVSTTQVSQRVYVPREEGKDAEPFFFDWRFFSPQAGLYCLTDAQGELLEEIIMWFTELGEIGLGTDKSVGGGKFRVETDSMDINPVVNANTAMLLSLYIPTEEEHNEIDLKQSSFELLVRGGYIAGSSEETLRHLRKRSVYMYGVGSLLHTQRTLKGKIVDLKPQWNDDAMHSVYRSGRPFYIPIKDVKL